MIRAALAALCIGALAAAAQTPRPKPTLAHVVTFCPVPYLGPFFIPCADVDAITRREWSI